MPADKPHNRARHHVRLPSGKQIEVVYLENPLPPALDSERSATQRRTAQRGRRGKQAGKSEQAGTQVERGGKWAEQTGAQVKRGEKRAERGSTQVERHTVEPLHVCFYCTGELAYPIDWAEAGPERWRILLRCPECEATREGVFDQADVERLDDELDRATGRLVSDLQRVTHANMAEEVEIFARALEADLILPSDF
jgi:hypothetical protein